MNFTEEPETNSTLLLKKNILLINNKLEFKFYH